MGAINVFIFFFKFLELKKHLESDIADSFLEAEGSGVDIVQEFICAISKVPSDLFLVDISYLGNCLGIFFGSLHV